MGANAMSAVSPGIIVLMRCPKVGTGGEQVTVSAQLEQSLSSRVHFAHAELSTAEGPRVVICTHSDIDIAQENKLFIVGMLLG